MIVTYKIMTLQALYTKCVQDFTTLRELTINQPLHTHFKSNLQVHHKMFLSLLTGKSRSQHLWGARQNSVLWFSPVRLLDTQKSPWKGADPMCWPRLGCSRLDHQGRMLLPGLEPSIAVALPRSPLPTAALILQNCGSNESLLIAKRIILQQSPNLICWVKKLPLHLENSSSAEGDGLRYCCILESNGNKFFYLPAKSAPLSCVFPCFNLCCCQCLKSKQCSRLDPCNRVSDYRPNNRFYWQTLKTFFCSEAAVQIALQHFIFIVC